MAEPITPERPSIAKAPTSGEVGHSSHAFLRETTSTSEDALNRASNIMSEIDTVDAVARFIEARYSTYRSQSIGDGPSSRPMFVGLNGVQGSGKTTLVGSSSL
jgi:hypothetical protein